MNIAMRMMRRINPNNPIMMIPFFWRIVREYDADMPPPAPQFGGTACDSTAGNDEQRAFGAWNYGHRHDHPPQVARFLFHRWRNTGYGRDYSHSASGGFHGNSPICGMQEPQPWFRLRGSGIAGMLEEMEEEPMKKYVATTFIASQPHDKFGDLFRKAVGLYPGAYPEVAYSTVLAPGAILHSAVITWWREEECPGMMVTGGRCPDTGDWCIYVNDVKKFSVYADGSGMQVHE